MANHHDDPELDLLVGAMKALASPFRAWLNELHARYRPLRDGVVAGYIPELARANPD